MSKILKRNQGTDFLINDTGQNVPATSQVVIDPSDYALYARSSDTITALSSGDLVYNDGAQDILDVASATLALQGNVQIFPTDVDGRPEMRTAVAEPGAHYEPQCIQIKTSEIGSSGYVYEDEDGNDLGFVTCKIYNASDVEITDPLNRLTAVKTVIDWEPTYNYSIIGAVALIPDTPAADIRMWVKGLPDVMPTSFLSGGINLKHVGALNGLNTDGRTSKYLKYADPVPGTNKMRIILKYPILTEWSMSMIWEIYKL